MSILTSRNASVTIDDNFEKRRSTTTVTTRKESITQTAIQAERALSLRDSFKLYGKGILFSIVFSTAIIMEGYDTNLLGNFYAFPQFQNRFGDEVDPAGGRVVSAKWQTIIGNCGQAGSILGLLLNGILSERFGYRWTMLGTMLAMIGAIFIPFFAHNLEMFVAASVIQGIPWGIFQTLAATYAADVCPQSLRAYLTSYINLCWIIGQLISSGLLRGLLPWQSEWSYRLPFALQWVWPIPIMVGTLFSPESPWWLVRKGRFEDARQALCALTSKNSGVPFDVDEQLAVMRATDELEKEQSTGGHYWDCFRGTDLRRTEISIGCWLAQTLCGATFMGYSNQFYQRAGLDAENAFSMSLGQSALGFVGTILSWYFMSKFGRRTLYIFGLSGGCAILIAVGVCGSVPQTTGASWAAGSLLLIYFTVFQLTVGPVCYSLVAEIPSTRLRIKTVALARAAYNAGGFINNAIMPQMIGVNAWNLGPRTGYVYASISAVFIVWCFFRLPEPKGLTYSDLDLLFEHKVSARQFSREAADALVPNLARLNKNEQSGDDDIVEHLEKSGA